MNNYHREVAHLLDRAAKKKGSIRKFIYESKLENKKQLLKLCCEVAKHRPWLQKLAECPSVKVFLDRKQQLAKSTTLQLVLIYELLMGQWREKIAAKKGGKFLLNFRSILKEEAESLSSKSQSIEATTKPTSASLLPRYARVNTLRRSFSAVVAQLELDGWRVRRLKKGIMQSNFRRLVQRLNSPKLYVDPHIDNLLIFPHGTDLHDSILVLDGSLVLQDKASCIPAFVLQPVPSSYVIDACAAPGMKTTHLAALMQNNGCIWAFDRDQKRLGIMEQMIDRAGASNIIETKCTDFLKIDVFNNKYAQVEFVLVDPPCSGSGMAKRSEHFDEFEKPDEHRIQTLANLQVILLKHALRLPSLRRLVYSTCSVHWTENEGVVLEILSDLVLSSRFQLIDPLPQWRHRGKLGQTDVLELKKCLRASPKRDLTNGFFVALFERKDTILQN